MSCVVLNKVSFNALKQCEDHKRRKKIINKLISVAYDTIDIVKHMKIAKPPAILAGAISKSLKCPRYGTKKYQKYQIEF